MKEGHAKDVSICRKAFMSIHGITEQRVKYIKGSLTYTGHAPINNRGKQATRPHKLTDETVDKVKTFIGSIKEQKSHYSLKDTKRCYLPEELNVKKAAQNV